MYSTAIFLNVIVSKIVIENYLLAPPLFEICAFETRISFPISDLFSHFSPFSLLKLTWWYWMLVAIHSSIVVE